MGHIDDVPVTHQAAGGAVQTSSSDLSLSGVVSDSGCVQSRTSGRTCDRARRHARHVLGSRVQSGAVRTGSSQSTSCVIGLQSRDVGHVEHFHVTFAGQCSALGFRQVARQAAGGVVEGLGGQCGHRAGVVRSGDLGQAIGISRHSSRPHVARRQENLEVQQVVRVGSRAETHLGDLAVDLVGVGDVQHGHVAVLRIEVRHHQSVAHAASRHGQSSCGRRIDFAASIVSHGASTGTDNDVSRCGTREAQATNHGSNAQGHHIFFHTRTPVKKLVSATTTIDYARES